MNFGTEKSKPRRFDRSSSICHEAPDNDNHFVNGPK
uniref:Uncharacterized protein n=1 Tax=Tetranychus urticae TaxID=32264 RepID=T1KYM9_TETUR